MSSFPDAFSIFSFSPLFSFLLNTMKVCLQTTTLSRYPHKERWARTGQIEATFSLGGRRIYNVPTSMLLHMHGLQGEEAHADASGGRSISAGETEATRRGNHYIYARISSAKQHPDLDRQVDALRAAFPNHNLVTDVASGINWQTLLDHARQGIVQSTTVAHRDRLCRFAFELLEHVFSLFSVKIHVVHASATADQVRSKQQKLAEDLMVINTVFICRAAASHRSKRQRFQETQVHDEAESPEIEKKSGNRGDQAGKIENGNPRVVDPHVS